MGKYNVEKKVELYMEKHGMLSERDGVLAGVSGGADSVCLLLLIHKVCSVKQIPLHVVHVNHGVREDAAEDAQYVETLCADRDIPFHLVQVDMEGYARKNGLSSEEAGRILRYEAFETYKNRFGLTKIAVAHNKEDRAETMLFHLFRGTGMKGLCGMLPVREEIIRPLLCLSREEIEGYLKECNVSFQTDSTNQSDAYTRNRIRHHILPYAKENICEQAVERMNETAEQLTEIYDYLKLQTKSAYKVCVEEEEDQVAIRINDFLKLPTVLQKQVLLKCFEAVTPHRKDITATHIGQLMKLMQVSGSTKGSLPYKMEAYKEYDRLYLRLQREEQKDLGEWILLKAGPEEKDGIKNFDVEQKQQGTLLLKGLGELVWEVIADRVEVEKLCQNIPQNQYTKCFDYDKISTSVSVRTRRSGDYLVCDTAGHRKRVKEYMIQEKIPRDKRDSMWLLAEGERVLWIPGYRISECYKVDDNTKRILSVRIQEENDGRTC